MSGAECSGPRGRSDALRGSTSVDRPLRHGADTHCAAFTGSASDRSSRWRFDPKVRAVGRRRHDGAVSCRDVFRPVTGSPDDVRFFRLAQRFSVSVLGPDKALVFRIVHRDNLPWLLDNGLCCPKSARSDPGYVSIGSPRLIAKRRDRAVPVGPGRTLGDYIPFYFTPWSPMLMNMVTGWGEVRRRDRAEILFLVSSLPDLQAAGVSFVGTDRHSYLRLARFSTDPAEIIGWVDWDSLRKRDFRRDPDHPDRFERYQAECLVWERLDARHLRGIACQNDVERDRAERYVSESGLTTSVRTCPAWYFPDA